MAAILAGEEGGELRAGAWGCWRGRGKWCEASGELEEGSAVAYIAGRSGGDEDGRGGDLITALELAGELAGW